MKAFRPLEYRRRSSSGNSFLVPSYSSVGQDAYKHILLLLFHCRSLWPSSSSCTDSSPIFGIAVVDGAQPYWLSSRQALLENTGPNVGEALVSWRQAEVKKERCCCFSNLGRWDEIRNGSGLGWGWMHDPLYDVGTPRRNTKKRRRVGVI